jgi:RNA polymerase sporulation-specific sigma factor
VAIDESLSEAVDEELVELARGGDDRAIEMLLVRYRAYARAKARTYFLAGGDREDIVQEGMIGLYKAIRDYESGRETPFRSFAELCIKRQIISAVKSSTRQKHAPLNSYVSLNTPVALDGTDDKRPLQEVLETEEVADPAELVISAEEVEALKLSLDQILSAMETQVLEHYMNGCSYQEIARTMGRHVKSIDNALQRIKRKLEEHLETTKA